DVAADSQEELQDWVKKIREVAQTADARRLAQNVLATGTCHPSRKPRLRNT
ncbi:PLCG1 isoform 4, partial [Pan troglodytes]